MKILVVFQNNGPHLQYIFFVAYKWVNKLMFILANIRLDRIGLSDTNTSLLAHFKSYNESSVWDKAKESF